MNTQNVSAAEVHHFDALASRWWDPEGDLRTLHDLNPARVEWIAASTTLAGARVVDVGCGGGLLSEALAARGASVTGIDLSAAALSVARLHLLETNLDVRYAETAAEDLAREQPGTFDVVACMELLEHVPDPAALVASCARLARPGGMLFFSSISRTPKAWALAIVAAEYVLGLVPRGTHRYEQLVRPSELDAWARQAGLALVDLAGLLYDPTSRTCRFDDRPDVNYVACFRRPGTASVAR
jgi:2-polyprenyl-6-hydroxyphenyl methylase/3-demethylubiquinone-9 3-methyltransferase